MSMVINRRHIILASLVVALGLAIFLNYKFSDNAVMTSTKGGKSNLGDASYVDNQNVSSAKSDIYATWRLTREQNRDEIQQIMNRVSTNKAATPTQKKEAVNDVIQMGKNIQTESQVETEVKAKGFAECVCLIDSNGKVSVVVKPKSATGLNASDSAQIFDIVESETKATKDAIKIIQGN